MLEIIQFLKIIEILVKELAENLKTTRVSMYTPSTLYGFVCSDAPLSSRCLLIVNFCGLLP